MAEKQIDHVAINGKWKSSLQDVRVKRSVDAGSAHHLAVAEIKMRLLAIKRTRSTKTWYDIMKLRDRDSYDAFVLQLSHRYEALRSKDFAGQDLDQV